jgi:SNF2 family DNA or RNA helicase
MSLQLMEHQRQFVEVARRYPRYGVFFEPGLGKTITLLSVVADAGAGGFAGKTVVVAPKSVLWAAWAKDAEHFPQLKAVVCWANSAAKRRRLIQTPGADVLILNFEAFKTHAADLLEAGVTRLIIDEASKLKSPKSQISNAAFAFSQRVESVYLLSGTPAPNGAHEYFALMRCIDANLFGTNYWRFINSYFHVIKRNFGGKERVVGFKFLAGAEPRFLDRLRTRSQSLRAVDCLDLPAETDAIRDVMLGAGEVEVYANLLTELAHEWDDGEVTHVKLEQRSMKLRQVTGGTLYDAEHRSRHVGDSKLSDLLELLEELGHQPLVVWCEFTSEIDKVTEALAEAGHNVGRIDGRTKADERGRLVDEFQAGRLQVMVCHPAACGHGITLTAARFDYFYSLGFIPENHDQARKRIHRIGQHWPVVHYYAIARGTVDEKVLKVLKRKATASEAIKELLAGQRAGTGMEVMA